MPNKKPIFSYKTLASVLSGLGAIIVQILNEFHIFFNNDIIANIITAVLAVGVVVGFVSAPPSKDNQNEETNNDDNSENTKNKNENSENDKLSNLQTNSKE